MSTTARSKFGSRSCGIATSRDPESPTFSTSASLATSPHPSGRAPHGTGAAEPERAPQAPSRGAIAALDSRRLSALGTLRALGTIGLGMVGALLHGLAPLAGAPPESATQPLLHAFGWLAWGGAAACAVRQAHPRDASLTRAGGTGRTHPATRLVSTAGTLGVIALGSLLRWSVPGAAGFAEGVRHADAGLLDALHAWPGWLAGAVFVVAPALGEEAFFRGAALRAAAGRVGPLAAAAISAVLFAACHPVRPAEALAFGAALALLALATGRIREAIAAHAAHNALGLWLLASGVTAAAVPLTVQLAAAGLAVAGCVMLARAVLRPPCG